MRYLFICAALLFLFSCKNGKAEKGKANPETTTQNTKPTAPPPAPPLPANMSVPDLRNEVRKVLRMQLPNTYPETRNGTEVRKGYSFDVEPYAATGKPVWIVQEKLYEPGSAKILTGGKYFLLWANVDPNSIGYSFSENGERIAIVVRAKKGQSFIFHPYAQELQDEVVTEVVIGWYDRVQDATLARAIVAMKTLAVNMGKWSPE